VAAVNWLAWSAKVPHWFTGNKSFARAIVQIGAFVDPDLPDVPMLSDLVKPKDKPLLAFMASAGGPLAAVWPFPAGCVQESYRNAAYSL